MINGSTFSRFLHVGFFVVAMSQAALAQNAQQGDAAPALITLTLPDGSKTTLLSATIKRIRKAIPPETQSGARTRIDWLQSLLVRESPEDVAALVERSIPSLAKLRMPEGSPIWFKGGIAQGPMPLTGYQLQNGVHSAIVLGDSLQFLASTPEEVRQELSVKGGNALPEPQAVASVSQAQKAPKQAQKPQEQVPELTQPEPQQVQLAGENIRSQKAQVEQTPQPLQPQHEQVQLAGENIRLQPAQVEQTPQPLQPQQEQVQLAGENIRLKQTQAEQTPQPLQLEPQQAQPVGEIIWLQKAQPEQTPQPIQLQPQQAQQVGEIIRLQKAQPIQPQLQQTQQVGEIIRLQQGAGRADAAAYPAPAGAGSTGG